MTFNEILTKYREIAFTEKEKGTLFEKLMKRWLQTDPRFSNYLSTVWLWDEFPSRKDFGDGKDCGIDLVARTDDGDYWAIQCKCYAETTTIDKPAVDSFLSWSSKFFLDPDTFQKRKFSHRLWISTTNKWGPTALAALENQDPPVNRIGIQELMDSPVDWAQLEQGEQGDSALREGKKPMEHQLIAMSKAKSYFKTHDRGKLIMACGTGKTYTSLKIAESMLDNHGLVLFMVPSIALLGQTLNAWFVDAEKPIKAICICSDNKASQLHNVEDDTAEGVIMDLVRPASTNPKTIAKQLIKYRKHDGLTVVFSTYQSIDAVTEAQQATLDATDGDYGIFDVVICDEAHRTTGITLTNSDESNFVKIHKDENVQAKKRLYMTATPRIYGENAQIAASKQNGILFSMDNKDWYGEEFYRVGFGYAVQHNLLTDYKVLVLTMSEDDIKGNIREKVADPATRELTADDATKMIGVINGLSKKVRGDNGVTWNVDPRIMHRAVAFCSKIGKVDVPGSSKNVAAMLPMVSEMFNETLSEEEQKVTVHVQSKHIDGSMDSQKRNEILSWLKEDAADPNECRVVTNVRCLSEGVDVPALDAVLFLSARNSQVDIVQSVGRVMRNFRRGTPEEKKYGYIIIPVVVPSDVRAEDALSNSKAYNVVWDILNGLRAHDDRFNAYVNSIQLNKKKPKDDPKGTKVVFGGAVLGQEAVNLDNDEVAQQLMLKFGEFQDTLYAKLVEKCGDRIYWETWAHEIGDIAKKFIERISRLVLKERKYETEFNHFLKDLQANINPSVDADQAIEMLAQHMITRPVFDALFSDYNFVENNAVSRSMQQMLAILADEAFEKDTEALQKFYDSVKMNVSALNDLEAKQSVIKTLYEKFFKAAFPLTVEKLGIVYTPIECVDFIIHSVEDLLKREFNTSLTEENVHVLDPFTGTGTFITRLLQSGLIRKEDMRRKYLHEIHCNEIVLLAYYIADVNIESVYHDIMHPEQYENYDGICLTDTFQMTESDGNAFASDRAFFPENTEQVQRQKKAPVRVIIGNPPYSVGQKSANDNAQNLPYPQLDKRIADTYAKNSSSTLSKSLYDSYIKAFRWASDRISKNDKGGIIAFISNGAWLDGNGQDMMRKCLQEEFSSIYVLNLRGNQRTSGELSRREGGKIFGSGSRTPIAITFLVKKPGQKEKGQIFYHDIGDYLTREQKLKMVRDFKSVDSPTLQWQTIQPTEKYDWINQRDDLFDSLIRLNPDKKFDKKAHTFFNTFAIGVGTNRDAWVYNSSKEIVKINIQNMIDFYNEQKASFICAQKQNEKLEVIDFVSSDETKISWTRGLRRLVSNDNEIIFEANKIRDAYYRPFVKSKLYFDKALNESQGISGVFFPLNNEEKTKLISTIQDKEKFNNLCICVSGIGVTKEFSCIISDILPDLELIGKSQCFPLYYYEEKQEQALSLFSELDADDDKYIRRDGITDWILKEVRNRFSGAKNITKEMIFYYVYGYLHSPDYRQRFSADLKKSLPRIDIVNTVQDFMAFYNAGKQLADIHLNYESVAPCPDVQVSGADNIASDDYARFAITKMRFAKKQLVVDPEEGNTKPKKTKVDDKSIIIYNEHITISDIPEKAYEYIVNGKSAIEWIMERYAVTVDKKSGIRNNPNDWSREHNKPRYILDLLLSVINVSCQTVDIVNSLPKLHFD